MGINFDDIWGQAKEALNTGLQDLEKVGKPALYATVLDNAEKVIQEQKRQTSAALDAGVKEIAQRPKDPNSFASQFLSKFQNPVIKEYGMPILVAGVLLIGVGFLIRR